ncbi:MAG: peptide-methionine (S)-S-oxide reductase MsrA [Bacteroidales bacterium]
MEENIQQAIFAGGCFWGVEHLMQKKEGVIDAVSGYTGGDEEHPTYREVCLDMTNHIEAVRIRFNPNIISYRDLAKFFFEIHDPEQEDGQGPDHGEQYRSEIFYLNDEQRDIALELIEILKEKGFKPVTRVTKAKKFWEAEDYHQDYFIKNPNHIGCHFWTKRF